MSSEANVRTARGDLFLLSAPSGAGKTTLIRGLFEQLDGRHETIFSISHTTRRPRRGELDGREYHFVDATRFRALVAAGGFLEWAEVHGNLYGTSRAAVEPHLERGVDVIVDVDVQGAEQLMKSRPDARSIFVVPPSWDDLVSRLTGRGLDGSEQVQRRLAVALDELRRFESYDYVIVNDEADRATQALVAIVLEKRFRCSRMAPRAREVIAAFERARDRES